MGLCTWTRKSWNRKKQGNACDNAQICNLGRVFRKTTYRWRWQRRTYSAEKTPKLNSTVFAVKNPQYFHLNACCPTLVFDLAVGHISLIKLNVRILITHCKLVGGSSKSKLHQHLNRAEVRWKFFFQQWNQSFTCTVLRKGLWLHVQYMSSMSYRQLQVSCCFHLKVLIVALFCIVFLL